MLTALHEGRADIGVADARLVGDDLAGAAGAVAERVAGMARVAIEATPTLQTVVAVCGAVAAGVCVVPLNPSSGETEREHLLGDAAPDAVLTADDVDLSARAALPAAQPVDETPAFVVYTSGTTGPPKGAVLSRRAVVACLDGLAERWQWSSDDVLAHSLPLFHVHGLVLGVLGCLRHGSAMRGASKFRARPDATIYFAVPTMWSRIGADELARMGSARLLVSGSAALPAPTFVRVRAATGKPLVERYGLTESLIVTAATPAAASPGHVGHPLEGVSLRVADTDESGLGEVQLRGATLFSGYLNRDDATAAAMTTDGWLRTGDIGTYGDNGLRVLGRLATDLIKTGGFKVGAGEVEDALLSHAAVAEAAVLGAPDDDLGERIVAWVVTNDEVDAQALADHVASTLAPHKRPRDIRFVDALPRNDMGKVQKSRLTNT